jgi:hypothetical protein
MSEVNVTLHAHKHCHLTLPTGIAGLTKETTISLDDAIELRDQLATLLPTGAYPGEEKPRPIYNGFTEACGGPSRIVTCELCLDMMEREFPND